MASEDIVLTNADMDIDGGASLGPDMGLPPLGRRLDRQPAWSSSYSHLKTLSIPLQSPMAASQRTSRGYHHTNASAMDGLEDTSSSGLAGDKPASQMPGLEPTTVSISNHFLEISKDRLSVKYVGKGNHTYDVGVIRANRPFSSRHQPVAYFEAKILDAGVRCSISIGLSTKDFTLCKHPGSDGNSYGFFEGRKYHDGRHEVFGQKFATGDTIGCGLVFEKMQVFFTLNGKLLGTAFRNVRPAGWYPSVGLHSPSEHVLVNFGNAAFMFDIEGFVEDERRQKLSQLNKISVDIGGVHHLIRNYLLHNAYEETFKSFAPQHASSHHSNGDVDMNGGSASLPPPPSKTKFDSEKMLFSLERRGTIRRLVLEGHIGEAMDLALEQFPEIKNLPFYPRLRLVLLCQKFVEIIKEGGEDRDDRCIELLRQGGLADMWRDPGRPAVQTKRPRTSKDDFGTSNGATALSDARGRDTKHDSDDERRLLQDVTSLLAYMNPEKSPQAWLLNNAQRERVADALNTAILASLDPPSHGVYPVSSLELLARQLVVTRTFVREGGFNPHPPILSTTAIPSTQSAPPQPSNVSPTSPTNTIPPVNPMSASPVAQRSWLSNLLVASPLPLTFPISSTAAALATGAPRFGTTTSSQQLDADQVSPQGSDAARGAEPQRQQTGRMTPPSFAETFSDDELDYILSEVA